MTQIQERRVTVMEFRPKPRQLSHEGIRVRHATAKIEFMSISEDEAKDVDGWMRVHGRMLDEFHVNMKFIVVPNGTFLPVPIQHYQ